MNSDMPAMPIADDAESGGSLPAAAIDRTGCNGLSKREYIAAMALQGLLSHGGPNGEAAGWEAEHAVGYADALLAELERTGGKS